MSKMSGDGLDWMGDTPTRAPVVLKKRSDDKRILYLNIFHVGPNHKISSTIPSFLSLPDSVGFFCWTKPGGKFDMKEMEQCCYG